LILGNPSKPIATIGNLWQNISQRLLLLMSYAALIGRYIVPSNGDKNDIQKIRKPDIKVQE